jgi:dTDP-4-amino-4,6-dideoxygalactose transaminase
MGIVGCLSFFPSKNLGGLGDGGMVVTNDEALAERLRILRVHGAKPKYYHRIVGGNFRLDTLQAAALNVKLGYLDRWTALRQHHAAMYEELFHKAGLINDGRIRLPSAVFKTTGLGHYHIYNQFVIGVAHRDQLQSHLKAKGIGTEIYYPVPLHRQECLDTLNYQEGQFPEAERASREVLALPVFPELNADQQHYVVQTIREWFAG